ncbi:hypothetical protein [Streptomyces sp. KL116D]|uniref:hypothetical protein n=1 Tax=Streptomyces sp. KL116D TaxID=3045152 RepID=UPI00355901A6
MPVLIVLVLLFIAGRPSRRAGQKTDAAAQAAARCPPPLQRTPGQGQDAAQKAARQALSGEQQACSSIDVGPTHAGLAVPRGHGSPAVTVTVACRVPVGIWC